MEGVGTDTAIGVGTVQLKSRVQGRDINITLNDVLHLPSLPHNLISLGRIEARGATLTLKKGQAGVTDNRSKKTIMTVKGSAAIYTK